MGELEDLVLFEGRVGNPGIYDQQKDPSFKAKHSDPTFWEDFYVELMELPDVPDYEEPTTTDEDEEEPSSTDEEEDDPAAANTSTAFSLVANINKALSCSGIIGFWIIGFFL